MPRPASISLSWLLTFILSGIGPRHFALVAGHPAHAKFERRQAPKPPPTSSGMPDSILYTIVTMVALFILASGFVLAKKAYNRAHNARNPRIPAGSQLTAAQLAGTTAGSGPRPRARRPRRTPSQMSTRSLPAYNEEPRDEDVVLLRALPEEDHQDESSSPRPSGDSVFMSPPVVVSDTTTPLLQVSAASPPTSSINLPTANSSLSLSPSRLQFDSGGESENETIEMSERDRQEDLVRERGAAPGYFEAIEQSDGRPPSVHSTQEPPSSDSHSRFSTMRNFLSRARMGSSREPESPSGETGSSSRRRPSTPASTMSIMSSASSVRAPSRSTMRSSGGTPIGPRPRPGSIAEHGTGHRSSISVGSISAPLPHTLLRTEYTFPKSGPTPQQIKFLSSRETLSRFGVPFGEDAIAAAAAARSDREMPPPPFEAESAPSPQSRRTASDSSVFIPVVETVTEPVNEHEPQPSTPIFLESPQSMVASSTSHLSREPTTATVRPQDDDSTPSTSTTTHNNAA